jgi:hypothetical protein
VAGVKRASLPSPHIYTEEARVVEIVGECSTTPTVAVARRHVAAQSGAAVTITVPLGHDDLQYCTVNRHIV